MESKKYDKLVNKTKRKQTHRYREQISGYQWREGSGVDLDGIMLSEISLTEKDKYSMISLICGA